MKKRVLQLTGSFRNGGSERQAVALARGLREHSEVEVYLATLDLDGPLRSEALSAGFTEIPEFKLNSFFDLNFVKQVRRCAALIKEQQVDLIHTHDFYTNVFGTAAAELARVSGKVASKRETFGMRSGAQDIVEKLAFGRADRVVVNSRAVQDSLTARGILDTKIELIYNGLDLSRFAVGQDIRKNFDIPAGRRLITLVANLRHDVKNVPMFLRAAKLISERVSDAVFMIAGEGELERELKSLAQDLGVADTTYFIGRCDDIPGLLSSSYACVLTSKAEGFSNSIIEYMAAGKPVVATRVGGAAEAIAEGQTGYLVDPDNADSTANRVIDLLKDPDKAARFGQMGQKKAQQEYSLESQISNTLSMYRRVLDH